MGIECWTWNPRGPEDRMIEKMCLQTFPENRHWWFRRDVLRQSVLRPSRIKRWPQKLTRNSLRSHCAGTGVKIWVVSTVSSGTEWKLKQLGSRMQALHSLMEYDRGVKWQLEKHELKDGCVWQQAMMKVEWRRWQALASDDWLNSWTRYGGAVQCGHVCTGRASFNLIHSTSAAVSGAAWCGQTYE